MPLTDAKIRNTKAGDKPVSFHCAESLIRQPSIPGGLLDF